MSFADYYNLPEGNNATLKYSSFYDTVDSTCPCPSIMNNGFSYQTRRVLKQINVSNVTDMSSMCRNCTNLQFIDGIENWDVSNVTDMSYCFYYCTQLLLDNIKNWDVSNLTKMDNMFEDCRKNTSLDLSGWDTSKVTSMSGTFNISTLTTLSSIRADSLIIPSYGNLFGYNSGSLVDFGGFINLKSNWNGSYSVDKLSALSHQSLINILNGLYDFVGNGETPTSSQGKIKFGSTHLAKLTEEEKAIATNKGWTLS